MPLERRRPLGHHDGGAVAVETALVSMLLLILVFGIIETSFLFKDWLTVSAAARAGARMGSSEPRVAGTNTRGFADDSADQVTNAISGLDPTNIQEVWVYDATYSTGLPDSGSFASCGVCVKYKWDSTLKKLAYLSGSWPALSQNACPGDPNRDALGVYVKYQHAGMGFFFHNTIVSESTVMWIEPLSANVTSTICKPAGG
jgi:hypothetical protein